MFGATAFIDTSRKIEEYR